MGAPNVQRNGGLMHHCRIHCVAIQPRCPQGISMYHQPLLSSMTLTYHGMVIAIPEDEWRVFSRMRPAEMLATLRELAQKVRLKAYRKSSRGPKKPRPKHEGTTKASHVSTAKLLRNRKVNAATP